MKYCTIIANKIPLKTKPLPREEFTSVNQSTAPTKTTIAEDTPAIKIRNSQISAKYCAINSAKSESGLITLNSIDSTHY